MTRWDEALAKNEELKIREKNIVVNNENDKIKFTLNQLEEIENQFEIYKDEVENPTDSNVGTEHSTAILIGNNIKKQLGILLVEDRLFAGRPKLAKMLEEVENTPKIIEWMKSWL